MKVEACRVWALGLVAMMTAGCGGAPLIKPDTGGIAARYAADARAMCDLVPKVYAFYATRSAHWSEACRQAQVEAAAVTTPGQGTAVLEHLVDALWDAHASLGVNTDASPWLVPSGSDLWLEAQGTGVLVTGVRYGGAADRAGIRVGDRIVSINGLAPHDAAKARIRTGVDDIPPERMAWALNAAGAGHRGQTRKLILLRGGERIALELGDPPPAARDTPLSASMIGD
ncbi:MAG: PDZ domain-containing protein, partial [Gammaproteobacteria bacterium]